MKSIKTHILMHFIFIVFFSLITVWLIIRLSNISVLLSVLVFVTMLFSAYLLMARRYFQLQGLLTKAMNELYEDNHFKDYLDSAHPDLNIEDHLKPFHKTTQDFETKLLSAMDFIKKSHLAIEDLNRINMCKSSTLDTILAVSHHILDRDNDADFYSMILNAAIDVLDNASKGSILLLNPNTNRYEYQTAVGYKIKELKKVTFSLEETFLYQNTQGDLSRSMVVSSVKNFNYSTLSSETFEWIKKADGLDIAEALSTPIVIDGKVYAILNIDSLEENAFTEVDIQLIQFFSTQISIAIKNRLLVEETIKLSKFDKLTGAYNRNYFEKIFESHSETTLENLEPFALILCDLNFLKIINDTYGHTAGDLVLSEFSANIQNAIRDTDVFSRVGGDEFVILLKNIPAVAAEKKMSDIFSKFENLKVYFGGHRLPVSFSYGIATSPDDSMIYDVLVKIADIRMYEFKKAYKEMHPDIISQLKNGI